MASEAAILEQRVRMYFADHHGEVIYPSDVAEEFNVDYDKAEQAVRALEAAGHVRPVGRSRYTA